MIPTDLFLIDRRNARLVAEIAAADTPRVVGQKVLRLLFWKAWPPAAFGLMSFAGLVSFLVLVILGGVYPPSWGVFILILVIGLFAFRREYRWYRHGRVILGVVQSVQARTVVTGYEQGPEGTQGPPISEVVPGVTYSFTTPCGRELTNWVRTPRGKSSELSQTGWPLVVLFLDAQNYRVL